MQARITLVPAGIIAISETAWIPFGLLDTTHKENLIRHTPRLRTPSGWTGIRTPPLLHHVELPASMRTFKIHMGTPADA